jgi:hypothetical protein
VVVSHLAFFCGGTLVDLRTCVTHCLMSLNLPPTALLTLLVNLLVGRVLCADAPEGDVFSSVQACIGRQCHSLHALPDNLASYGRSSTKDSGVRAHPALAEPFDPCCTSCSNVSGCSNSRNEEQIFVDLMLPHLLPHDRCVHVLASLRCTPELCHWSTDRILATPRCLNKSSCGHAHTRQTL